MKRMSLEICIKINKKNSLMAMIRAASTIRRPYDYYDLRGKNK